MTVRWRLGLAVLSAVLAAGCIRLWPDPDDPRLPGSVAWCEGAPHVLPVPVSTWNGAGFAGHYGKDVQHCIRYLQYSYVLDGAAQLQVKVTTGDEGQLEAVCAWAASFDQPDMVDCVVDAMRTSSVRLDPKLRGQVYTFSFFVD